MNFNKKKHEDTVLQELIQVIHGGWPTETLQLHSEIKDYWDYRDEMAYIDGLVFKGKKMVIPLFMRTEMLQRIHEGHSGMVKCKQRARDVIFWPGMVRQIEDMINRCSVCAKYQKKNQAEPLVPHKMPDRPWAKVGSDIFEYKKKDYVLYVCYYSKFAKVVPLPSATSKGAITTAKSVFARHGIPDELVSDNGPQYDSAEFAQLTFS